MSAADHQPAESGEEIHLPGPSAQPLLITVGITIALLGVTFNIALVVIGLALTTWQATNWIRECRRDLEELPAESTH